MKDNRSDVVAGVMVAAVLIALFLTLLAFVPGALRDIGQAQGRACGCANPRLVLTGGASCDKVCP